MRFLLSILSIVFAGVLSAQDFETTPALFGDLRARQIGPALMSGRVSCITVDPTDANTVYIGAGGGGVWRTTNAGSTVQPIFDDHPQSIGAIAIAPADVQTIYVGTGEPWPRNSVSVGNGIYKSGDGGNRWTHVGLDSTERISSIAVHPTNTDIVYVAALGPLWSDGTQRGVFKSTDGGANWEKILYLNESTGAADLSLDANDPEVLLVAMWDHRRTPHSFDSGYGGQSGLYRSHNGGRDWELLHDGLPDEKLGRIGVAIAPGNGKVIYASVETGSTETKGMYRSDDGGDKWSLIDRSKNSQLRPFYFAAVTVDPSNDSIVAKCGYNGIISENAGDTWSDFPNNVHADHHAIWIDPADGKHLLVGTDGGVYESRDRGRTFKMWQNLPLSQFYHVSVDQDEPYNVYGGLQDNGSTFGPSQSPGGISNADWKRNLGGDGFYSFRHPTKNHFIFSESQGGGLARFDERVGRNKSIAPYGDDDTEDLRFNWNAPIHLSADGERLYFASQFVFRSDDDGESWERISPDLTTNDTSFQHQERSGGLSIDNSGAENYTTIYTVAESPLDENTVWVGTDDGNLRVTNDGGKSWAAVGQNITDLPGRHWVTFVEPSPHDPLTAFVTFDGHRTGDQATYLYRTDDGGEQWVRLEDDDLLGYALSVRQDPVNPDLLFLGTEFGLYLSLDGGDSWAPFRNNVPMVGIRDMVIQTAASDLVMATHGRGIIILDDLEVLRQITPAIVTGELAFLDTPKNYFYDGNGTSSGQADGHGFYTGENPTVDTRIAYYAPKRHTFGKMYLEVFRDGELIRTLPAGKSAGLNMIPLPTSMRAPRSPPTDNSQAWSGTGRGPTLPAGTYQVRLTKGKESYETEFTLGIREKSLYNEADRAAQYDLVTDLFADSEQLAYLHEVLVEMDKGADKLMAKSPLVSDLIETIGEEKARLAFIGGDHYVNEEDKLGEEVSKLYASVSSYPGKPSVSQVREAERLHAEVTDCRRRVEAIIVKAEKINETLDGEHKISWPEEGDYLATE